MFRKAVSVVLTVAVLSPTGVSIAQGQQNEKSLTEQMKEQPKTFTYKDGLFEGTQQANEKRLGRGGTGFVVGFFTGFVGTGIGYASIGPEEVPNALMDGVTKKGSEYRAGFIKGWENKTKSKKRSSFVKGGLAGTAVFVAILVVAANRAQ